MCVFWGGTGAGNREGAGGEGIVKIRRGMQVDKNGDAWLRQTGNNEEKERDDTEGSSQGRKTRVDRIREEGERQRNTHTHRHTHRDRCRERDNAC